MSEWKDKKVLILGIGRSGQAAANLLHRNQAEVIVSDSREELQSNEVLDSLHKLGIKTELGGHSEEAVKWADLIVVSPGIPLDIPILKVAMKENIPVIGELELGAQLTKATLIAVTGTNGKSTTTVVLGRLMEAAFPDRKTWVAGNIGWAFCNAVTEAGPEDCIVVEVSSFQLESIKTFHPHIAVLLNMAPDHLDRYPDFQAYIDAKSRVAANMNMNDYFIYNASDENCFRVAGGSGAGLVPFSSCGSLSEGVFIKNNMVVAAWKDERREIIPVSEIGLPGLHNCENIMAAVAAVLPLNPDVDSLVPVIKRKDGVPHRMEFVREICGVTFYNDSKATNVASVVKVLSGLDRPVVLIAGGRAKEKDFSTLKQVIRDHCRSVVLMGESAQAISEGIGDIVPKYFVQSMNEAVLTAQRAAVPGDIVLLAPACASFDMFRDFEERGESFKTEVGNLKKTNCPEMVKG